MLFVTNLTWNSFTSRLKTVDRISGGSKPSDKGCGAVIQTLRFKKFFSALRVSVWSKKRGDPVPRARPLDPPLRMLYLGNVLLRYVLIYNLKVSSLIFQLSLNLFRIKWVMKMFTDSAVKTVFFLTPIYLLRAPNNSNFFRLPLKVRVIWSRL